MQCPNHQDRKGRHARRGSVPIRTEDPRRDVGGGGEISAVPWTSASPFASEDRATFRKNLPARRRVLCEACSRFPPARPGWIDPFHPSPGAKFTPELTSKVKSNVHVRVDVRWRLSRRATSFVVFTRFCSDEDASFRVEKQRRSARRSLGRKEEKKTAMSGEHGAKHEPSTEGSWRSTWSNRNHGHTRREPSHGKKRKRDARTPKLRDGTKSSKADP